MISINGGIWCSERRAFAEASSSIEFSKDASGFSTAILSELEDSYELSIWLHVYGFVKIGSHVAALKKRGKRGTERLTGIMAP